MHRLGELRCGGLAINAIEVCRWVDLLSGPATAPVALAIDELCEWVVALVI